MRTTGEVARELGVSIRTIQEAVRSGKVASTRWGRKYLLPPESVELLRAVYGRRQ